MLLHIRPRLFCPFKEIELVDLRIEPLGLRLRGGVELTTRRPYPNKCYAVACRREGRMAVDGIMIDTDKAVGEMRYVARWAIGADFIATHHVRYRLLDVDFDAASDDKIFWSRHSGLSGDWSHRGPEWTKAKDRTPFVEPRMEVVPGDSEHQVETVLDRRGWIVERREEFAMPTLERDRIVNSIFTGRRTPLYTSAFHV